MFMTYDDREKVREALAGHRAWFYGQSEYSEEEARVIIKTEIESEINDLIEKVRILKLAKSCISEEGL